MPGANEQWHKADVVFEVRDWRTLHKSQYKVLQESEEDDLLDEVQVDDCVEVFFVDKFDPSDNHGGGVTFGVGTASTQIISSDENADHGIDLTHLAHELGHAMALHHPEQGFPTATFPNIFDGSTGTLMCPSGFMNDNPAVNSQDNADNINNDLFRFSLKFISPGPDCTDDADCGSC